MSVRRGRSLSGWVDHWKSLTRFFGKRLPTPIDAQDLAQEVYLRLLRVEDLDAIEAPQAYLYRVARNIAAEWHARTPQVGALSQEELGALVELTTPESMAEDQAEERAFDDALRTLPTRIRAVVYLKLRDGKTHEEIAAYLGMSPRMVRKDLTAAYAALRRRLVKE